MDSIFKLAVILSAVDHLTGPLRDTARQLQAMDNVAAKAKGMQAWGEKATIAGITAGAGAAEIMDRLKSIVEPAMQVEDAITYVGTVVEPMAGTVTDAMGRMREAAEEWSRAHTGSAADFIKTSYRMISAGLNERAAIEATRTAMTVASATTLGVADSQAVAADTANLLATIYNNLGNKTVDVSKEMMRIGDIITGVQQKFQFPSLSPLTEGMKAAAKTAVLYRVDLGQVATVIGQLNNAGVQGATAGYAFNEALLHIDKAAHKLHFSVARTKTGNLDLIQTIANMEKRFGALETLSPKMQQKLEAAFGVRGIAIAQLLGRSKEMAGMMKVITDRTGAAVAAQKAMESTGSGQWQIMRNNLEVIQNMLGGFLIPLIKQATPYIGAFVDRMSGIIQAQPSIFRVGLGLLAILGVMLSLAAPILISIGGLMLMGGYALDGFTKFAKGALTASRYLINLSGQIYEVAATRLPVLISRMSVFLQYLRTTSVSDFIAQIRLLGSLMAQRIVDSVNSAITAVASFGKQLLQVARTSITVFVSQIDKLSGGMLTRVALGLKAAAVASWEFTASLLANPIVAAIAAVVALAAGIYLIYKYWQPLADFYERVWDGVKSAFNSGVQFVLNLAKTILTPATWYNAGAALIDGLVRGITSGLSAAVSAVGNVASGITDRIKNLLGISSPSRVFQGFGSNIVQGLTKGMERSQSPAIDRIGRLARATTAAMAIAAPAMAAPSVPTITPAIERTIAVARLAQLPVPQMPTIAPPAIATTAVPDSGVVPSVAAGAAPAADGGSSRSQTVINFSPVINLSGTATEADRRKIIDDLRPFARELKQIVDGVERRDERKKY